MTTRELKKKTNVLRDSLLEDQVCVALHYTCWYDSLEQIKFPGPCKEKKLPSSLTDGATGSNYITLVVKRVRFHFLCTSSSIKCFVTRTNTTVVQGQLAIGLSFGTLWDRFITASVSECQLPMLLSCSNITTKQLIN